MYNIIIKFLKYMSDVILGDSKTRVPGDKLKTTDQTGLTQLNDLNESWIKLRPEDHTWIINNVIRVTGYDVVARLNIGDKIRVIQNDFSIAYKYFYITAIYRDDNGDVRIAVEGGTGSIGYYFTSSSIISIYYSKDVSPAGFPGVFQIFQPTVTDGVTTPITGWNTLFVFFTMVGGEAKFNIRMDKTSFPSSVDEIRIYLTNFYVNTHFPPKIANPMKFGSARADVYSYMDFGDNAPIVDHISNQYITLKPLLGGFFASGVCELDFIAQDYLAKDNQLVETFT